MKSSRYGLVPPIRTETAQPRLAVPLEHFPALPPLTELLAAPMAASAPLSVDYLWGLAVDHLWEYNQSMPKRGAPPLQGELLQGTLDLLILQTLILGPAHGHTIAHA